MEAEHTDYEIEFEDITKANFPYLAFDRHGLPALYGDPELEKELGLPDNIRAVEAQNGVVHSVWQPAGVDLHAKEAGLPKPIPAN